MTDSAVDDERTVVRTYVPAYQRDRWDEHADRLDMSRSEFVRTMVQAGRESFGAEVDDGSGDPDAPTSPATDDVASADLEAQVIDVLERAAPLSWEELVDRLTDDLEDRLEETLEELQAHNRVRYSGRDGGYTLQHE